MRKLLVALALIVATFAPAHARGLHATIEGPAKDGVTYTVRAVGLTPDVTLKPWVCADGLADGRINSLRMDLKPTAVRGVYTFKRTWPHRGDWMLRVCLADPLPAPSTIAAVSHDGRVQQNQRFWNTYGVDECRKVLLRIAKEKGITVNLNC